MLKAIRNFFNGLAFGITETIPGVSGGTIALILGFYFELIETINHFTENFKKRLQFLIPLIIGVVSGILLFSSLINFLLMYFSFPTMLFFIGLISGIIPHIYARARVKNNDETQEVKKIKFTEILLIIIPFIILITLSFLKNETGLTNYEETISNITFPFMIFIFFSGILAAAALVIPGISGSFVLLLLGLYPLIIYSVSSIRQLFTDNGTLEHFLNICKVLGPLALGVIIGGLSMARLIEKLLKNYQTIVYSVILGLLSASVIVLFKDPIVYKSGLSIFIVISGIITFSAGCVLSFFLGKKRL